MKRGIALLMALVMALALTVCTQTPPPNRGDVEGAAEPDAGYSAGDADIVQLNGFRSIHIDWTSGRVTVELYDGQGIELSETMMDGGDVSLKMEWRVDEDDSTLDILSQPLTVSASEKKHLTVKLPRSMVLHELDINAVSADVSVDLTEEDTLTLQELDVSSVSGTVIAVEPHTHPNKGPGIMSVVIKNDGKNTLHESVVPNKPLEELTPDEIVEIVKEKGIVGMGGATFPTYVKLKPGKPIDAVLINGSECEPYLTADHRVMLEFADDIVFGLRAMMKAVSAPEGVILIEDNKPDAIALMEEKVAPYDNIRVCAARTQYPEGAEKMLIKKVMGRQVPSGKLPADVGCVVSNTSTAKAISDAIQKGMPLVERVVSVTGEFIRNPGNYIVKLGTNVQEIIDHCGGVTGDDVVLKMGGPMMGAPIMDTNVPIIKGSNGIIAIAADHTEEKECIKCGRCMDVCPMELAPLDIYKYAQLGDAETLLKLNVMDCFSCKCCEYICSSKIPLVSKINAAKGLVMPLLKKK